LDAVLTTDAEELLLAAAAGVLAGAELLELLELLPHAASSNAAATVGTDNFMIGRM